MIRFPTVFCLGVALAVPAMAKSGHGGNGHGHDKGGYTEGSGYTEGDGYAQRGGHAERLPGLMREGGRHGRKERCDNGCNSVVATPVRRAPVPVRFPPDERALILGYFHQNPGVIAVPAGLPPGIARKYRAGGKLPPGIAKKMLPPSLVIMLPPPPRGYDRVVIDADVLLVEVATGIVRDILWDVLR